MTINERMFEIISQKCIKQKDLADALNVKESLISAWKTRGTNPPSEYLINICKVLEISLYELLGEPEPITNIALSENETELLKHFRELPDREQIKMIGRVEDAAAVYKNNTGKSSNSMIG